MGRDGRGGDTAIRTQPPCPVGSFKYTALVLGVGGDALGAGYDGGGKRSACPGLWLGLRAADGILCRVDTRRAALGRPVDQHAGADAWCTGCTSVEQSWVPDSLVVPTDPLFLTEL